MRLICRFTADPRSCSRNAQQKFRRYGLPVLCVAKFVPGLDCLMPPLGGAEGVPLARFLALDAVGSLLWSGCYAGLGYVFSNQLDIAIRWVQHFGTAARPRDWSSDRSLCRLAGTDSGANDPSSYGCAASVLRCSRANLKSDRKVAVLDLSNFEEESGSESVEAIPGAFVVDPSVLRKSPQIAVPDDVKIILYCSSGSDAVSARAAMGLKRIGVDKVWVLEGGLKAWREHGSPSLNPRKHPKSWQSGLESSCLRLTSYARYGPATLARLAEI